MIRVISSMGHATLTASGKRVIAASMYEKGKGFIGAALLLRRSGAFQYVVLHLLCQGIELILKALLLFLDYEKYKPQLLRIGHDLIHAVSKLSFAVGAPALKSGISAELATLNSLYKSHLLRYGTGRDIFLDPACIPYSLVLRRTAAMIRLIERRAVFSGYAI